jgi:hypothetical protein
MTAGNRRRMRIIIAIAFFSQWSANVNQYIILETSSLILIFLGPRQLLSWEDLDQHWHYQSDDASEWFAYAKTCR